MEAEFSWVAEAIQNVAEFEPPSRERADLTARSSSEQVIEERRNRHEPTWSSCDVAQRVLDDGVYLAARGVSLAEMRGEDTHATFLLELIDTVLRDEPPERSRIRCI